jgi:ribosomal protein S18 acetylase RimI-like enzyme
MMTKKESVDIRSLRKEDVESASELLARLKRLNGEFDPLLKTVDSVEIATRKSIEESISAADSVLLVAVHKGKVLGYVGAKMKNRLYYEPRKEGAIVSFYILPEFRRGGLGTRILSSMIENLRRKGADLITAEFPSQNEIASKFYAKHGFRSLTNVFAKAD